MGLYEGIKDAAKVVQEINNIKLHKTLIELSEQALEMQNKVKELFDENNELKKINDLSPKIERNQELFITLIDDSLNIKYCSHCWDSEKKLIQIDCFNNGTFKCPHCKYNGIYDYIKQKEDKEKRTNRLRSVF
jgi:hypothetical protein